MTDGLATGWHHALWAVGYLIGLTPVLLVAALVLLAAVTTGEQATHRVRVHKLRRQARRSGRATDRIMAQKRNQDSPPHPFPCHCRSPPPGRRDLTGHEPDCPDHPIESEYLRAANR